MDPKIAITYVLWAVMCTFISTDCPANSEATQTGLTECPCVQDYYRADYEDPSAACTRKMEPYTLIACDVRIQSLYLSAVL